VRRHGQGPQAEPGDLVGDRVEVGLPPGGQGDVGPGSGEPGAMARPIPRLAPVTRATRSSRRKSGMSIGASRASG
jgi:hypothetical protein